MAERNSDNSGALFKNDKKTSDKQPDYRGPCQVGGEELEVSAWIKTAASGVKYMSLAFAPPFKPEGKKAPAKQEKKDEVPF